MELPLTLELQFETNDNNKSSVNPLKKKLLSSHQEETIIPLKKIHLDSNVPESFFGLPDTVRNLIKKYKGIDKLYEWQEKCLNTSAMHERRNLIYAVPTSGGKTLVAEMLMLKEIVCRRKNAMFILPYVSSVQEKIQLMKPFATELNFFIEEHYVDNDQSLPNKMGGKNSLSICTIEKAQGIINYLIGLNRLDEIGIIVVDELHLLGESGGRGATLECLLTKVIHSECNVQIVGMSATIGNLKEIALFLNAILYEDNYRPVGIKEYVKCGSKMWLIDSEEKNILTNEKIIEHKYTPEVLDRDPDFLGHLVLEIVPNDSCLVFCSTKKNCESVVTLLSDLVQRHVMLKNQKVNEKLALLNDLKNKNEQICPILQKTIPFGFAYHHSGLTAEERRLIEKAFRSGVLCVICCTSTLAMGVNLPARRVIIRSPYISNQFLNLSRYKQMIGRAGRAGLREVGESILVSSRKDFKKVCQFLSSKMDDSMSRLHKDKDRGIKNLIASAVLLSMGSTRADLHRLVSKTLLKVQEDCLLKSGITLEKVADEALVTLVKDGILVVKENFTKSFPALDNTEVLEIQMDECEKLKQTDEVKVVKLTHNTQLELCPLGKAAIKGLFDLKAALALYQKFKTWIGIWKSKQNLDSEDQLLHLVSLITPCDIANQITLIENDHCDIILRLPESKMQVARLLDLNEVALINMRRGTTKPDFTTVIKRFYVTLILHELSQQQSIHDVAKKYEVNYRTIKSLLSSASSFFSQVVRFCKELDEFHMFAIPLLEFARKLTHYGAAKLELLMKLPFVQKRRATQLQKAGYTLQSIATANCEEMAVKIKYLSKELASQIISDAEVLVQKKEENLPDEAEKAKSDLEI